MTKADKNKYIECRLCGVQLHSISQHLKEFHPEITLEEYKAEFPDAPLLSDYAKELISERTKIVQKAEQAREIAKQDEAERKAQTGVTYKALAKVFDLPEKVCKNQLGNQIEIGVLDDPEEAGSKALIPAIDDNYIYDPKELKYQLMALELNIPCLVWGDKGSGKTEGIEQICARTNRSFMRVQHTTNTEEVHVVGQWIVKDGETQYQLGSLPLAMINGWVYCADEYDFTPPHVLSVYQSVLEGKALVIKDAPEQYRIIKPHKNFRFFATGNTNGTGDETGSYAGVLTQNSANYDRFGIVVHKEYLPEKEEIQILTKKTGLRDEEAKLLVSLAGKIRKTYREGKINDTISPRALINASHIGIRLGNLTEGLKLAFINKLTSVDQEIVTQLAQRVLGES